MILPAISIRQPWAWAILHAGKDVENRTWALPKKYLNRPILIHAGKNLDHEGMFAIPMQKYISKYSLYALDTGGIVGVTVFIDCTQRNSNNAWAVYGQFNWRIDQARTRALPFFPCPGRLGFFEVDYPHEVAI